MNPSNFASSLSGRTLKRCVCSRIQIYRLIAALCVAQALLLDTYVKGVPGGTGEAFNWDWVAPLKRGDACLPIILAGGLTADNVGQAVQTVQPWAVDVSGGVEAEPGKKSVAQIQAFVEAVNASART